MVRFTDLSSEELRKQFDFGEPRQCGGVVLPKRPADLRRAFAAKRPKDVGCAGLVGQSRTPRKAVVMATELAVIDLTYDFGVWLDAQITRFPRAAQHRIGALLISKHTEVLDALLAAKFSREKAAPLRHAALVMEQIRFQLRLCRDRRYISHGGHEQAMLSVAEISRQIQGWRKYSDRGPVE